MLKFTWDTCNKNCHGKFAQIYRFTAYEVFYFFYVLYKNIKSSIYDFKSLGSLKTKLSMNQNAVQN